MAFCLKTSLASEPKFVVYHPPPPSKVGEEGTLKGASRATAPLEHTPEEPVHRRLRETKQSQEEPRTSPHHFASVSERGIRDTLGALPHPNVEGSTWSSLLRHSALILQLRGGVDVSPS